MLARHILGGMGTVNLVFGTVLAFVFFLLAHWARQDEPGFAVFLWLSGVMWAYAVLRLSLGADAMPLLLAVLSWRMVGLPYPPVSRLRLPKQRRAEQERQQEESRRNLDRILGLPPQ